LFLNASCHRWHPMWARGHCRISPPHFLAECCNRQLNRSSFVLLYFRLFPFSDLYWVCLSVFSCTVLFFSISQVIDCEDCLRNDLYCVEWGVKLYSNQVTDGRPPYVLHLPSHWPGNNKTWTITWWPCLYDVWRHRHLHRRGLADPHDIKLLTLYWSTFDLTILSLVPQVSVAKWLVRLTAVWEDPGSNHSADSCVYCDSCCSIQSWAQAVHL